MNPGFKLAIPTQLWLGKSTLSVFKGEKIFQKCKQFFSLFGLLQNAPQKSTPYFSP